MTTNTKKAKARSWPKYRGYAVLLMAGGKSTGDYLSLQCESRSEALAYAAAFNEMNEFGTRRAIVR